MITFIAISLAGIFGLLSALHLYWAFGGQWATQAVVPSRPQSGKKTFQPSFLATMIVALGLALMACWSLALAATIALPLSENWLKGGMIAIASIFAIRAIGDFRYAGLSKRIKDTAFARNDSRIYTPLCVLITTLSITLLWLR